MCLDCWEEAGKPQIDNEKVRLAVDPIETIYEYHAVGGPFHVELDDWNVDGDFAEPHWGDGERDPLHVCAAELLAPLMRSMSLEERYSALAIHSGFWTLDDEK